MGAAMTIAVGREDAAEGTCRLCESSRWIVREAESRLLRMPPGTIIRTCRGCGLSIRTPLPLGRDAAAPYDGEYYHQYQVVGREASAVLVATLPLLEPAAGPGRLLEIGCGLGSFLASAGTGADYSPDEATGRLVPPADADALAAAAATLIGQEAVRARLGRNAAVDAAQRFGLELQVERYLRYYEEVLAGVALPSVARGQRKSTRAEG